MMPRLPRFAHLPMLLLVWSAAVGPACAVDVERRDFSIFVDGKEAGLSRIAITVQDDGTTVMTGSAQVQVRKILFDFYLKIDATEWWKEGKLIGLKSNGQENSRKFEVVGAPGTDGLRIRVNGRDTSARPDVWTTSYWKLADPRFHNKDVPLLDPLDGKEYQGKLQYVGTEQLTIADSPQQCYRFRIAGGPRNVDLWYDKYHRLVRQEFAHQGNRVIVQLIAIRR